MNWKVANTVIGRDVREALARYDVPTLAATVNRCHDARLALHPAKALSCAAADVLFCAGMRI